MPHRAAYRKARSLNGHKLVFLAVAAGVLLVGTFYLRSYLTNRADESLCEKLAAIVAIQPHPSELEPGDYGYSYAHAHPGEWPKKLPQAQAIEQAKRDLRCAEVPAGIK